MESGQDKDSQYAAPYDLLPVIKNQFLWKSRDHHGGSMVARHTVIISESGGSERMVNMMPIIF